jgi:hypothetical protein
VEAELDLLLKEEDLLPSIPSGLSTPHLLSFIFKAGHLGRRERGGGSISVLLLTNL